MEPNFQPTNESQFDDPWYLENLKIVGRACDIWLRRRARLRRRRRERELGDTPLADRGGRDHGCDV